MNKAILAVLGLAVIALGGLQLYTISQLRSIDGAVKAVESQQAAVERSLQEEIERRAKLESEQFAGQQQAIDAMKAEVERARRQAASTVGRVQEEAQKRYEALAEQLSTAEKQLAENQARVAAELSGVRQASSAAQSGISNVSEKVEAVQSQVAATRTELSAAVADLQRTRGDLGQLSGLIATNSQQIESLRALGDREYTEFTVFRRKDPVPLGGISVLLKKTDEKNQRYSVDLFIDDRKIEKKDRVINEPLQFYIGSRTEPYELVVNQVRKDQIVGYLATPKTVEEPAR